MAARAQPANARSGRAPPAFAVEGNRLSLLDTGPRRLRALLDTIAGARRTLRVLYYTFADDRAGTQVRDALVAACGRGVAVRLVVDGFGSAETGRAFFDPLRAAGASVCRFEARWGRTYLLRNHQKLLLADAEDADLARAVIGGFNVQGDYFAAAGRNGWRDLGLVVEGAAAARVSGYFDALDEWIRADGRSIRRLNRTLTRCSERDGQLRWLIGGPTRRLSPWARALRDEVRAARRIDVVAGYFTPSPTILRGLRRAGRARDVAARVVTASRSDNETTVAAARFSYAGLMRRGVRIFEYRPTKLHTKLYVVDDAVFIGSANLDVRSLFINLEIMLRIEDRALADHLRGYIDGEAARSEEITPDLYRARTGWLARVRQAAAYALLAVADPGVTRRVLG